MARGPVEVLWAAGGLGQVIAPQEVSAVLLSEIVQLPGQQRLDLQWETETRHCRHLATPATSKGAVTRTARCLDREDAPHEEPSGEHTPYKQDLLNLRFS